MSIQSFAEGYDQAESQYILERVVDEPIKSGFKGVCMVRLDSETVVSGTAAKGL